MTRQWQHVMVNAKGSWLHGDPRGFRSREHRIHSSGDYKHPPPAGEHEGLHRYQHERIGKTISFELAVRIEILRAFVTKLRTLKHPVIAACVAREHLHELGQMPRSYPELKKDIGKCKQAASHAVRDWLPGSIWSQGLKSERIRDKGHLHNTYNYIRKKQEAGTVVWSHRADENWIDHPEVGVVVMGFRGKRVRVYLDP